MKPQTLLLLTALAAAPALAATPVTLDWTAKVHWTNQSGAGTNTVVSRLPVQADANGWFTVTGRFVINRDAPAVQGFSTASGYWSADALDRVEYNLGGSTFVWQNQPGMSSANWGLSLLENGSNDIFSTANAALPYYGGMSAALTPATAGVGLLTAPQPLSGYSIAMPSLMFYMVGSDLLGTQLLAGEDFAKLAGKTFGPESGGAPGTTPSRLFAQLIAMPLGSTDPQQHVNAQNLDGYFTSFTVSAVPEPTSALLAAVGVVAVLWRRRQALGTRHTAQSLLPSGSRT